MFESIVEQLFKFVRNLALQNKYRILVISIWMFSNVLLVSVAHGMIAKYIQVEGWVKDNSGIPISEVSVYLKSYVLNGTITDSKGHFQILCPEGLDTLVFKHIAFQPKELEIIINDDNVNLLSYQIQLEEKDFLLKEVVVSGSGLSAAPSIEKLKSIHRQIAGGTSVVLMNPEVQRLETVKDALKYESGVVIQEFFGANDQPRLSIRGSGIQSNPQRRGIYLLQDGIPVNFADGSFVIGVVDPAISESVEVLKGANALRYGAATLGGAVNFNSRTGRYSPGMQFKLEGGSFGHVAFSTLMGNHWGKKDAFFSISGSRQNGFREHNQNKKLNIAGNFGYRISDRIDNRTYLNYSYINFDIPGPLTLDMLQEDPSQINKGVNLPYYMGPDISRDLPSREAVVIRVANRTTYQISKSTDLTISFYYQYIKDRFVSPIVLSTQRSTGHDGGFNVQAVHRIGKGILSAGFLESNGRINRGGYINKDGLDSYMFSKEKLNAFNLTLYTEYHHKFSLRAHLIGDLQFVYNQRNNQDVFPNPELRPWYSHMSHKYRYFYSSDISLNQSFKSLNPRIGAIYNAGKNMNIQFFGNVSTSYEPPTFDELTGTKVTENINTSPKDLFAIRLDKQTAITTEIGSRHEGDRFGWNVSLYRSWIKNEMLEVKDFVLGVKETKNYPHTVHQGVELGFSAIVANGIFSHQKKDKLLLRAMYTYSDFFFSSDEYKANKLAGVPPHYMTATIEYNYPERFFVSFNMESQPMKSPIDHANTVYQPAYSIFGFRVGIDNWKNFSFYVEGKNVFNKYYASSYIISDQILLPPIPFPQFTVNNVAFFMPGQTRAFYVGLTYKFTSKKDKSSKNSIEN